MKKIFLALCVSVSFFLLSATTFAGSFSDLANDHKNYDAIEYLNEQDILHGYEDGTFKPDNFVNRAEAVKIIVGALKVDSEGEYDVLFSDVLKEDWFFKYIMAAQSAGVISGYENGTFKPGSTVNLAEMLKILTLAAKVELPEVSTDIFSDVLAKDWFAQYVLYARNNNLILANDFGAAHPGQDMTRGEFAEVVYRLLKVKESGKPFALDSNWDYYQSKILPFKMKYDSDTWQIIEHKDEIVFLKADKEYYQFSAARIYPNSAVVRVVLDKNDESLGSAQYFANIKTVFAGAAFTDFELKGLKALEVLMPDQRIVDWYVYLSDGRVLAVYTEFGSGLLGFQLSQFIGAMLSTLEYQDIGSVIDDKETLLNQLFAVVLVEGKGMEALNKVFDKIIIETDAIGVGTGPIDYYYSADLNYTFKYEREADVILDKKEGKTSAF